MRWTKHTTKTLYLIINNLNLIQNIHFDPNNRVGTKSFARKYKETHINTSNPDVSKENKFVAESSSYNLNTHFMLGTIESDLKSEKQDSFKAFNQYVQQLKFW